MKSKINGIIVVEGKTDVEFLSSFIDAEFVVTNGSSIPEKTIDYLKESKKDIYVLTDPDFPGTKIRDTLNNSIPNLKHCFISKENSIKHGKVGVAEGQKEEILEALKNVYVESPKIKGNLTNADLVELGLSGQPDSQEKRNRICEKYHLGHCNAKTFLHRLNSCNITKEELKNA